MTSLTQAIRKLAESNRVAVADPAVTLGRKRASRESRSRRRAKGRTVMTFSEAATDILRYQSR